MASTYVDFARSRCGYFRNRPSLLFHVLNATLLYLLLSQVTRNKGRCLAIASLFALHPLAVESVSWVSERKNVLCTFFFLLAVAAYGRYARRPGVGRYVLVAIAFALGLTAKPMVITLPFVLLLLDYWPLGRVEGLSAPNADYHVPQFTLRQLVLEKLPLLALCVGSAIITLVAQASAGAVASTMSVPLTARIENAIYSYFAYIGAAFWPAHLAPFYPEAPLAAWQVSLASLFLGAVSFAVWRYRFTQPHLIAGWLFYLGTLVPVIGIIQVGTQAMADRYTYIPMIGIFVSLVWMIDGLALARRAPNWARIAGPAVVLVILASLTRRQVRLWRDDVTLWTYNLGITKDNVVAKDNLGIALLQQGKTSEALPHFYHAVSLNPEDPISAANVATDLLANGRMQEAIEKYQAALVKANSIPMLLPNIHSNMGSTYLSLGSVRQAREHFEEALRLNPDDKIARAGLMKISQSFLRQASK